MPLSDLLNQKLEVRAHVVFHNEIYEIIGLPPLQEGAHVNGRGYVRLLKFNKSKTTRPVVKFSKDLCLIDPFVFNTWINNQLNTVK